MIREVLCVPSNEEGERADKWLISRYPERSRAYFQKLIVEGAVLLNGKMMKKGAHLRAGDTLDIQFTPTDPMQVVPEPIGLDVIYEDEYLLVVNKPAGMVVHPAPGHPKGTFANALLAHCQIESEKDTLRPGIVHRLDKETSGLLIAAKDTETHQKLVKLFASRQVHKSYLAICSGKPSNGTVNAPIGRHPRLRKQMTVTEQGKQAISEIQVIAYDDMTSLVLVRPETGRTHQIRVHLSHLGHPVVGDRVYGHTKMNQDLRVSRQLLHAYRLSFTHPILGTLISLLAPLPEDMRNWIQKLILRHQKGWGASPLDLAIYASS